MSTRTFGSAVGGGGDASTPLGEPITVEVQGTLGGKAVKRSITVSPMTSKQATFVSIRFTGARVNKPADAAAFINLILRLIKDDEEREFVESLLLEEDSGFDVENVTEVFVYCIEEWSDRPTARSSASSSQRPASGKNSTGATRRAGSTPSRSPSRASSTSSASRSPRT